MRIDVDVGDAFKTELLPQVFRGDTAIVKDAKTGRVLASSVMQSGDGYERALVVAVHHFIDSAQDRTDHR